MGSVQALSKSVYKIFLNDQMTLQIKVTATPLAVIALEIVERKILCKFFGTYWAFDDFRMRTKHDLYGRLNDMDVMEGDIKASGIFYLNRKSLYTLDIKTLSLFGVFNCRICTRSWDAWRK